MRSPESRAELAEFLRSRRRQIAPDTTGLRWSGQRRTPGLRREEVSLLSGVSLTWYTWLEQGRDIQPSRQVIDALARTLRLSPAEHRYALRITGHPAELNATCWTVFTDPYIRRLLVDWKADSRRFLTEFRAEAGDRVCEPPLASVLARLRETSEHFRLGWDSHDVDQFASQERKFQHPLVGRLVLEHHRLAVSDCPDLHVVAYTAAPDSDSWNKLARLAQSGS